MRSLKQSTARNVVVLLVASSDHVTGKTGATLVCELSKNGGALASISPTVTERSDGGYQVALTSAHTDTLGDLWLHIEATDADPIDIVAEVRTHLHDDIGSKTDALTFTVSNKLDANVYHWQGTAVATPTTGGVPRVDVKAMEANVVTAAAIATNAIDADALAADAVTEIQSGLATSANQTSILSAIDAVDNFIDTEIGSIITTLATLATASALSTAQTAITAIKTKTDQMVFTVANRVDATATISSLGTDAISAASISTAAVEKIRDGILNYAYRSGRTVRGVIRRLGAALEKATGLKGSTVTYYQPDGSTTEFSVTQDVTNGTRTNPVVTNSETP